MTEFALTKTRLFEGVWEGVLTRSGNSTLPPELLVTHLDRPVPNVTLSEARTENEWLLKVPIPSYLLSDGVQTFLILDARSDEVLDKFSLICGEPLDHDLRAEVDLLRAELDMLKRAFRRHCVETM